VSKRVLGAEHPDTLISAGNLAASLSRQGKYDEAEKMEREVLAVSKRVLGAEHPDTLTAAGNLAACLKRQGKYPEAELNRTQSAGASQRSPAPRGTMRRRMCAVCSAKFACAASFRGKAPKCRGCRRAPAHAGEWHQVND
jgi:hypothetical protein